MHPKTCTFLILGLYSAFPIYFRRGDIAIPPKDQKAGQFGLFCLFCLYGWGLTKVNAETTYATLTVTEGLHSEITANTVAISEIQEELTTLGIALNVNGIFTFTSQIISTSTLSAEISKCFMLQGQNNLTGNITSSSYSYTFYGAKPSEIADLVLIQIFRDS